MGTPRLALIANRLGANRLGAGWIRAGRLGAGQLRTGRIGVERPGEARQPRNPISRAQIETVLSRSVAGVSLIFALQSLPVMLDQLASRRTGWALALAIVLGAAIALVVVSALLKVGIRVATGFVSAIYLAELVAWPFVMRDPGAMLDGKPWLWYLCAIATACAAIAFPVVWAFIYTLVAPVLYGVLRSLPSGGGADALLASLDVVYAIIIGLVVLIIISVLRRATVAVDVAQTTALHTYAIAVRQHATEVERIEVDAIVHDSVLATLLSAAGVSSPKEAELVRAMAGEAIARLSDAGPGPIGDVAVVPFTRLSDRIRQMTAEFACPYTIIEHNSDSAIESLTLPEHVSEALYSATRQAMVNSVQHAGQANAEVTRTLTMSGSQYDGCSIEIADSGIGFDPASVPSERLGLRISIRERVTSVGGAVSVRTSVGQGTTITLEWPGPDDRGVSA